MIRSPVGLSYILKTAFLNCQSAAASHVLQTREESNISVAEGKALEVYIICPTDIEEDGAAATIENYLAISRAFIAIGLSGVPLLVNVVVPNTSDPIPILIRRLY